MTVSEISHVICSVSSENHDTLYMMINSVTHHNHHHTLQRQKKYLHLDKMQIKGMKQVVFKIFVLCHLTHDSSLHTVEFPIK